MPYALALMVLSLTVTFTSRAPSATNTEIAVVAPFSAEDDCRRLCVPTTVALITLPSMYWPAVFSLTVMPANPFWLTVLPRTVLRYTAIHAFGFAGRITAPEPVVPLLV